MFKGVKDTDIFDWMNSFEFNKNIKSLDNKFNIFVLLLKLLSE